MKFLQTTLAVAVALLALGADGEQQEWTSLDSEEGEFEVHMPGKHHEFMLEIPTPVGNVDTYFFMLESNGGDVAYCVAYSDYEEAVLAQDAQTILEGVRDGACAGSNLELQSDKEIEVEELPAREFMATGRIQGKDMVMHSRILLEENRLYQVMVITTEELEDEDDKQRFWDSFQLTP